MTMFAEKLKDAGADTIGSRLTVAVTAAIRAQPQANPESVWRAIGVTFGHDFVNSVMADMGFYPPEPRDDATHSEHFGALARPISFRPHKPRMVAPAPVERRAKLAEVVRSKFKTSAGISWSDITPQAGIAMERDAKENAILRAALPAALPNDGRTYGQILGVAQVDKLLADGLKR